MALTVVGRLVAGRSQVGLKSVSSGVSRALKALKDPCKTRNIIWYPALLFISRAASTYWDVVRQLRIEGTMATRQHDRIVETPTEARQAEPGPSVLALLTVSTGLAVLILGVVWFVFFRT